MRIAAQLYTVRDFTNSEMEFAQTLAKIAQIGYREVQLSAVACMAGDRPLVSANLAKRMLDDLDLRASLTHRSWEHIANTDSCLEFHAILGAEMVAFGSIPDSFRSGGLDGYHRFAEAMQGVAKELAAGGLKFAYHNHAFEFERFEMGVRPFEVLANRTEAFVNFELDTYWVVHAGMDLPKLSNQLSGRIPMIHVKDRAMVGNEARMAAVGEGNLDWPALIPQFAQSGVELVAVEQDECYGRDPFDCLCSSYDYLTKLIRNNCANSPV
ncbi:MAG TPA: sugar phosphate isomerase/epimerase [Fimbriimonadaceae bacterium]|nr:sugar phosphate isomerase/epimerase [Fimbriimonadaceae bacterium]